MDQDKEITLKRGNLYISLTVVISMMAGMFWGGYMMGKFYERLNRVEEDVEKIIENCK